MEIDVGVDDDTEDEDGIENDGDQLDIAIGDKGVKIFTAESEEDGDQLEVGIQEGDPIPDLDVKLGKQPCCGR